MRFGYLLEDALDRFWITNIQCEKGGLMSCITQRLGQSLTFLRFDVGDENLCAAFRTELGGTAANPLGTTGNQNDFTFNIRCLVTHQHPSSLGVSLGK